MPQHKDSKTLVDRAYLMLKQMIFQQNLISGQKLIAKDLSEIFHMSRTPIINALYQLEREGFVVSSRFRGFYVKPIDPKEAVDLFEVREALETQAVKLAIQRKKPGEIEKLEEIALKHKNYTPHYYDRKRIALGSDFHVQIAKMSTNMVLERQLKLNLEHVYLRFRLENAEPSRMQPASEEHYQIIDLIKKGDIPACVELMRNHVQRSKDHIMRMLSENKEANALLPEEEED